MNNLLKAWKSDVFFQIFCFNFIVLFTFYLFYRFNDCLETLLTSVHASFSTLLQSKGIKVIKKIRNACYNTKYPTIKYLDIISKTKGGSSWLSD